MIRAYVHIPPGRRRMIARGHNPCRQLRLDLLHQRPKLSLYRRVFVQQIRKANPPPLLLVGAGRFQFLTGRCGELLMRFRQPPLRCLGSPRIAAPEQQCELRASQTPTRP